jgi:hypothetical protein
MWCGIRNWCFVLLIDIHIVLFYNEINCSGPKIKLKCNEYCLLHMCPDQSLFAQTKWEVVMLKVENNLSNVHLHIIGWQQSVILLLLQVLS